MRFETLPVLLMLFISLSNLCAAQNTIDVNNLSLDGDLSEWYDSQVGHENTSLFIGTLAYPEKAALVGHPNHKSATWLTESIRYRGETFHNVSLIYDLDQDLLYIKNTIYPTYSTQPILPIQNQVEWFEINGDLFKYIPKAIGLLSPGFFQIIHEGSELSLIIKRSKIVKIGGNKGASEYQQLNRYFLEKNGNYLRFKSKNSLLKLFPENKKLIRKYIRQNNLKILKPGHDHHLKMVIQYCESL